MFILCFYNKKHLENKLSIKARGISEDITILKQYYNRYDIEY